MKRLFVVALFLSASFLFGQSLPPRNFGAEQGKLPKVTVTPKDYTHFRKTIAYEVMPKYKFGNITTMENVEMTEAGVYRHKSGKFNPDDMLNPDAMVLIMSVKMQKDGTYEVVVNLQNEAKSKKLAKEVEKAFKKKPKK